MERLTSWCEEIEEAFLSCEKCKKNGMTECWSQENCTQTVVDRLAEIEDILGNEYDLDRLRELVKADREGRCVVLPVKPRETFYTIDRVSTLCHLGYYFDDYDCQGCEEKFCDGGLSLDVGKKTGYSRSQVLSFIDSGKKIYLSEQEAESALKAMKERE